MFIFMETVIHHYQELKRFDHWSFLLYLRITYLTDSNNTFQCLTHYVLGPSADHMYDYRHALNGGVVF